MGSWSKLGKIASFAAPIIAAPFTGGASLFGLGGAAATNMSQAIPSAISAVGGQGGSSIWSRLAQLGAKAAGNPDIWRGAGAMLSAGAQASAQNRGAELEATLAIERMRQDAEQNYVQNVIAREQEGRASATDAWRKLQQAQYVQNATGATPGFSPYSKGIAAPTAAERQGASALEAEVMKRLTGGNPIPMPERMTPNVSIPDPSIWERLAGILGPGFAAYGAVKTPETYRTREPL